MQATIQSRAFFYDSLCLSCGDLNYQKRRLLGDLIGRVALVTGARMKIGYATTLRLLRAGAQVIATTRFPHDAARRYSHEPDFAEWQDRLHIYGLDFRYLPILEHFIAHFYFKAESFCTAFYCERVRCRGAICQCPSF